MTSLIRYFEVLMAEFVRKWCTASKPGSAPQLPTSLFAVLPGRHEAAAAQA